MRTQERVQVDRNGISDVECPELGSLVDQVVSSQGLLEEPASVIPT